MISQINIVRVWLPFNLHAHHIDIKIHRDFELFDKQSDMAYAYHAFGLIRHYVALTSTISKSWVILTDLLSMIEAEQYFSADSFTARSTCVEFKPWPVTIKCTWI